MDEFPVPEPGEGFRQFVDRCHRDPAMLRAYPNGIERRNKATDIYLETRDVADDTAEEPTVDDAPAPLEKLVPPPPEEI